jgi:fusion and transport protein UGO1
MPTFLHSIVSPLFTHGTPLLLRSQLGIDPNLTPATFSVSTFLSSFVELFARLPLETVLRRGQMSVLNSPGHIRDGKKLDTIVDIGPYRGVVGTMWSIVKEEGESSEEGAVIGVGGVRAGKKLKKGGNRKGQGVEGLWRGWRVGFWGLVGIWGAAAMGGSSGGEF